MGVNDLPRGTDAHFEHDELLLVAYASNDLDGSDVARAAELVASCRECELLVADVRAMALDRKSTRLNSSH